MGPGLARPDDEEGGVDRGGAVLVSRLGFERRTSGGSSAQPSAPPPPLALLQHTQLHPLHHTLQHDSPVVSITMWSNSSRRFHRLLSAATRSSRTVQQRQPLESTVTASPVPSKVSLRATSSLSMSISPNSFSMTVGCVGCVVMRVVMWCCCVGVVFVPEAAAGCQVAAAQQRQRRQSAQRRASCACALHHRLASSPAMRFPCGCVRM